MKVEGASVVVSFWPSWHHATYSSSIKHMCVTWPLPKLSCRSLR